MGGRHTAAEPARLQARSDYYALKMLFYNFAILRNRNSSCKVYTLSCSSPAIACQNLIPKRWNAAGTFVKVTSDAVFHSRSDKRAVHTATHRQHARTLPYCAIVRAGS